jgi:predicted ABC-class ATPase
MDHLRQILQRIDRRSYGAYKELRRPFRFDGYELHVDRVQGDPFAAPSQLRLELAAGHIGLQRSDYDQSVRRIAAEDFLSRAVGQLLRRRDRRSYGSGKSGQFGVLACGQEILQRTSCHIGAEGEVTFRLTLGLPAAGRRVLGREAWELLGQELPTIVDRALRRSALDETAWEEHLAVAEDQEALREQLRHRGLVAFLAEGSLLPRVSGASDAPARGEVVPLESPPELVVELMAPHRGRLRGLGLPQGVTVIVGGGYHGKSTLLNAVARSVYPHVPGDGREYCVTDSDAVVIRAEDGRAVTGTDVRAFIGDLPLGGPRETFTTADASGSTSQAAAIVEALEGGAQVLLVDEDTAATNFMIRDRRMRRLVPDAREPITPFIDRVRQLAEQGVSTVLVVGGTGDYLDVADCVVAMEAYRPREVTARAREVAQEIPARDTPLSTVAPWPQPAQRVPQKGSLNPRKGRRPERVKAVRTRDILFGEEEIDVSLVAQLVDPAQARALGDALLFAARELVNDRRTVAEILDAVDERIDQQGLASLLSGPAGDRARARRHELAAALNRLRTLQVTHRRAP